jgi:hypothetical protein
VRTLAAQLQVVCASVCVKVRNKEQLHKHVISLFIVLLCTCALTSSSTGICVKCVCVCVSMCVYVCVHFGFSSKRGHQCIPLSAVLPHSHSNSARVRRMPPLKFTVTGKHLHPSAPILQNEHSRLEMCASSANWANDHQCEER